MRIEGIISERDIVRGLRFHGAAILDLKVCDLMTSDVITCDLDDPLSSVICEMDRHTIRHVPVLRDGILTGIVSIRDIIKDRLDEVEIDALAMHSYIAHSG